ncbi:hypothetical protein LOK49_LG02G02053 [Camellia lanceoleosa]|uniref:Uncharacterized protein n=1 Tax=Camellia lanceoleosa TaxID=1840588 RepID=A0ACC0IL62_9ERIC|nr:hypothetical protein LOK49_LG02G02053 [Camellia lanceoleosa]
MALGRLQKIRNLYGTFEVGKFSSLFGSSTSYSDVIVKDLKYWRESSFLYKGHNSVPWNNGIPEINCWSISSCLYKCNHGLPWTSTNTKALRSTMAAESYVSMRDIRLVTTQAKAPPQARQMGSFKVSMSSPGIIYEPYMPREPISFWRRWFTRSGWRRTKEDIILELKSAYAINKLRKSGYSKQKFYKEALNLYKEINTQISNGNKTSLRKTVTEKMYSGLKNEIKQRESMWSAVYWELVEPVVKIRTLRARLIGVDQNDLNKTFIQLTLEFLTKQKFEAYDSKGAVVAGDKNKEVLVRDIWVFEKSMFHPGSYWRLCGRVKF